MLPRGECTARFYQTRALDKLPQRQLSRELQNTVQVTHTELIIGRCYLAYNRVPPISFNSLSTLRKRGVAFSENDSQDR